MLSAPARPADHVSSRGLARRLVAEGLGTALLLATVVGSGVMGDRLAGGNVAIALLANTLATGAMLIVLILSLGPISGGHFNPAVTLAVASQHELRWRDVGPYVLAQTIGALAGVVLAHAMFELPLLSASHHVRTGPAQWLSELVATFGLLATIWGCSRTRPSAVAFAVGAYISAAYWFTASTSFANPAVTLARAASDTFTGIVPSMAGVHRRRSRRRGRGNRLVSLARARLESRCGERPMKTVIFACVQSAGRSQMAAAFFNGLTRPDVVRAVSAGTHPAEQVHPEVVEVMREAGLDLSDARPRLLTTELASNAAWLVTMGCSEECPVVPGVSREDWPLPDPKGQPIVRVREIRDEIRARVARMIAKEGWSP